MVNPAPYRLASPPYEVCGASVGVSVTAQTSPYIREEEIHALPDSRLSG